MTDHSNHNESGRGREMTAPEGDLEKIAHEKTDHEHVKDHAPARRKRKPAIAEPDLRELEDYREAGMPLVPLFPRAKTTEHKWKTARFSWDRIRREVQNGMNAAMVIPSHVLVIDVDPKNGGDKSFEKLKSDLGMDFERFPRVETGSGGIHVYLAKPVELKLRTNLREYPGIDFKSEVGYVVAAGSVHPNGKPYMWDRATWDFSVVRSRLSDLPRLADEIDLTGLYELLQKSKSSGAVSTAAVAGVLTWEQLEEILDGLDAGDFPDNDSWLKLMMACHHATAGEGREVFIEWASGFGDFDDVDKRWDSLKLEEVEDPITIRTLEKIVLERGSEQAKLALAKVMHGNPDEQFGDDDFDKPAGAVSSPGKSSRKEATKSAKRLSAKDLELFSDWVYVCEALAFVRRSDSTVWNSKQWGPLFAHLRPGRDVVRMAHNGELPVKKVEKLVYVPGKPEFPNGGNGSSYNLWRDTGVVSKKGDCRIFLEHLEYLVPDEVERNYVLDYLAMLVQRPGDKIHYALLIQSDQGVGKSAIGELMKRILGKGNVVSPRNDEVLSKFSGWQRGASLAVIEELMTRGRQEVANRLKQVVTDPDLRIEEKFMNPYSVPNHLNLLCFTNHKDALKLENGDRRWLVLFSEAKAREPEYYDKLFSFIRSEGGSAAVRHYLETRQIGLKPKQRAPETASKAEMKLEALEDLARLLTEAMFDRRMPFEFDLFTFNEVADELRSLGVRGFSTAKLTRVLTDVCGAVSLGRYSKDYDHCTSVLWAWRNIDKWREVGAAQRADAYQWFWYDEEMDRKINGKLNPPPGEPLTFD